MVGVGKRRRVGLSDGKRVNEVGARNANDDRDAIDGALVRGRVQATATCSLLKQGGRALLKSIKSDVFLKRRTVLYRKSTYNSTRRTPTNRTNIIVWDMAGGRLCFPLLDQKVSWNVCTLP